MLKSFGIVATFPNMPSGCVDICESGPIPVAAGRLTCVSPGFNLPPALICMRRRTSSSFSCKTQKNQRILENASKTILRYQLSNAACK